MPSIVKTPKTQKPTPKKKTPKKKTPDENDTDKEIKASQLKELEAKKRQQELETFKAQAEKSKESLLQHHKRNLKSPTKVIGDPLYDKKRDTQAIVSKSAKGMDLPFYK